MICEHWQNWERRPCRILVGECTSRTPEFMGREE